jgi:cytochrome c peroxidase
MPDPINDDDSQDPADAESRDAADDESQRADSPRRSRLGCVIVLIALIAFALTVFLVTYHSSNETRQTAEDEARQIAEGEVLFTTAFADTNGRSCASCHVPGDNFTLTPEHVAQVWEENPNDPLFAAIDADDPNAEVLTFDHLKKGLVRVWLTLPKTMDVIDDDGKVITPDDRKIWVWRSVPSIADVALTAPYQLDGREASLVTQAQGAATSHSASGEISTSDLEKIAAFQESVFSSNRARSVAEEAEAGTSVASITDADDAMALSTEETRGRDVYMAACAACHGGGSTNVVVDREIHAQSFPAINADGTVQLTLTNGEPAVPFEASTSEFLNIGSVNENYMAQQGKELGFRMTEHVAYTEDLSYPQYRFRFYRDDTQQEVIAELPQPTADTLAAGTGTDGSDPAVGDGPDGNDPAVETGGDPGALPLSFTTDPGRAAITGNPLDFEAFDVPSLRGVARTAPYWHNNISADLEAMVDLYSDHLLAKYPRLLINDAPPQVDADGDIGPVEALSEQQKADLIAYLRRL